ncbi:hypothetical protein K470DRAFT_223312, partial [Piedraia hortae CBS 480.64]
YRSLTGYYLIIAGLNHVERNGRANVCPLTLGPHASNFSEVIDALYHPMHKFKEDGHLMIRGKDTVVFAFAFAFLGDMPQQQKNVGMLF